MSGVCAAVVTYNRRELLVECLDALLGQTHPVERIFVVDNASTDGTRELLTERGLLARSEIDYERLETNLGGAGGFARGVERAREGEWDWIWITDDDTAPRPDALARMLSAPVAGLPETTALAQAVVNPDGSLQLGARGHFAGRPRPLPAERYADVDPPELDFATFVGLLVRGRVARSLAPPRADFFLWGDDYEYCFRLREHGRIRLVAASEVVHADAGHIQPNRRARLWNRLFGWSYGPTPYAGFWRNICGVRNLVWINKHHAGQSPLGAAATVAQFGIKALLYDERPWARLPWIVRAGIDGRLGVFHNITPAEWGRRLREEAR